ncbi:hypothetical protein EGH24_07285 [Halonotius terrestris]|uniref:Uncharacterized protein n=1 Tax=Halonotius terrestris TaxID=2487750 RepID=A0A8J8P911_9EURY|nr:hypothetical protein [Halonotius terrestris]TQQ80951.1 hypothetical protein EGH24_07285 [Halonotius terrestris]
MVREELQTAADRLRTAAETADGDAVERLTGLADKLDTLATADRGPDHGTMARMQNTLNEVKDDIAPEAADAIDDAKAAISEYRSTVEGV